MFHQVAEQTPDAFVLSAMIAVATANLRRILRRAAKPVTDRRHRSLSPASAQRFRTNGAHYSHGHWLGLAKAAFPVQAMPSTTAPRRYSPAHLEAPAGPDRRLRECASDRRRDVPRSGCWELDARGHGPRHWRAGRRGR